MITETVIRIHTRPIRINTMESIIGAGRDGAGKSTPKESGKTALRIFQKNQRISGKNGTAGKIHISQHKNEKAKGIRPAAFSTCHPDLLKSGPFFLLSALIV